MSAGARATVAAAASALILASTLIAAPAHAATFTAGDYEFETTSPTTARITDYTGGPTASIPSTVSDGTTNYTVTEIGSSAFDSKGLTSVTIPDTVTFIGAGAFGLNSLTSLVIPDSVISIGTYAFQWNSIADLTLSDNLTSIPDGAFFANPLSTIDLPESIMSIGDEAFFNSPVSSLTIPDSVVSIGDSAFLFSPNLTSLHLGSSLESIGESAFQGSGLTTVTIPASVTEIGNGAFEAAAPGMESVLFEGAAPSTFTARSSSNGSLGDVDALVYYSSAYAADFTPSPWNGYRTAPAATLSFDLGGHGSAIAPVVVIPGTTVSAPADPAESGYRLDGWFTTATGDTPYDFSASLEGDATAYARWTSTELAATGAESGSVLLLGGGLALLGLFALLGVRSRRRSRLLGR